MTNSFEELDKLSSRELHDRATHHAEHHLDLKFLWELVEMLPVAEAAKGDVAEADQDIQSARGLIVDALETDHDGRLLDALRPLYIEYLMKHDDA